MIPPPPFLCNSVYLHCGEKITIVAKRDGGLDSLEVHGILTLNISEEKYGFIKIRMACDDDLGVQSQVN